MTRALIIVAALSLLAIGGIADAQSRDIPAGDACYSIGYAMGQEALATLRADGVELDAEQLAQGMLDALKGADPRVDDARMSQLLRKLEEEVRRREARLRLESDPTFRALAEENARRSAEFHARVATEPDIVTLDGGVQFRVIDAGNGVSPGPDDTVVVSFKAATIDGVTFAEAVHQTVPLSEMIQGAQAVLQRMRPGARWRVAIPPSMAFGEPGLPPDLGPNESIVADVTLHEVVRDE